MDITPFLPVPIPVSIDTSTIMDSDNRSKTAVDTYWGTLGQAREKLLELLHHHNPDAESSATQSYCTQTPETSHRASGADVPQVGTTSPEEAHKKTHSTQTALTSSILQDKSRIPDTPPAIILSDAPHAPRPSYEHLFWSISSADANYMCENTRNIHDEKSSLVAEFPTYEELDYEKQHSVPWSAEVVEQNIHRAQNILTAHHITVLIAGARAKNLHTTCLATLAHLSYTEPVKALGFPVTHIPMISDEQWITEISTMRDIMSILRPAGGNSRTILEKLANPTLCVLSGLFAYAAARGIPIIISDLASLTAAILAEDLAPGAHRWYIIGTSCPYPVYAQGVQQLFSTPHLPIECQLPSPDAGIFFYHTLKLMS